MTKEGKGIVAGPAPGELVTVNGFAGVRIRPAAGFDITTWLAVIETYNLSFELRTLSGRQIGHYNYAATPFSLRGGWIVPSLNPRFADVEQVALSWMHCGVGEHVKQAPEARYVVLCWRDVKRDWTTLAPGEEREVEITPDWRPRLEGRII